MRKTGGIVQTKYSENNTIEIKLTKIETNKKNIQYFLDGNNKKIVGDTIISDSEGWLKSSGYYFNYYTNKEYRK